MSVPTIRERREFVGFVDDTGKLTLDHPAQFKAFVARAFKSCEVVVSVEDKAVAKTRRQERGFHAMLKPWCAEGHRIEDLKRFVLAEVFGLREVVNPITGEVTQVLAEPHTSKLSKAQYSELIERTLAIAAECGVILEAPSEWTARTTRKRKQAA